MNIYYFLAIYICNINVSLLWPIMKAAVHFIIHVNGQQRVGTHSGQVGHFYEYHLMIFSFGQQNQVSTAKSNNCIIVLKKICLALCKSKVLTPLTKPFKMNHFSLNVGRPKKHGLFPRDSPFSRINCFSTFIKLWYMWWGCFSLSTITAMRTQSCFVTWHILL